MFESNTKIRKIFSCIYKAYHEGHNKVFKGNIFILMNDLIEPFNEKKRLKRILKNSTIILLIKLIYSDGC